MSNSLSNRVAVVTAAGSGMGRESAMLFASEGAKVVAIDIDEVAGDSLVEDVRTAGGIAEFVKLDMTDVGKIESVVESIGRKHGRIDVLFNHAGAPGPRGFDFDVAAWQRCVDLNLSAPIFMTKAALPLLKAAKYGGSIIFTSSTSGMVASVNSPLYSAVKAGVLGFMRAVAAVGGPDNIRANAICPGATETPMLAKFFSTGEEDAEVLASRLQSFQQGIPLRRIGQASEIAETALFLGSSRSSFITGAVIPVDGGYTAL